MPQIAIKAPMSKEEFEKMEPGDKIVDPSGFDWTFQRSVPNEHFPTAIFKTEGEEFEIYFNHHEDVLQEADGGGVMIQLNCSESKFIKSGL